MNILTFEYFGIVLLSVVIYYLLPSKIRWLGALVASIYFCIKVNTLHAIAVLSIMILIAYVTTLLISRKGEVDKKDEKKINSKIVTCAITAEVLILLLYKYNNFFTSNMKYINESLYQGTSSVFAKLIPAVAMSYFSLMLIGYIADVHWGKVKVQKNPLKLVLFTIFFPQMHTGPITTFANVENEFFVEKKFNVKNIERGSQRILIGVFKKYVIVERLAFIVNALYSGTLISQPTYSVIAVFGYSLQLYFDFSSSMDIVLGVSELFGINLPENFNKPFLARNLSEFWRRWHMTLGAWLREYILYPMQYSNKIKVVKKKLINKYGRKTGVNIVKYTSLFIAWFLVGFWHSGLWTYIWGSGLCFFFLITIGKAIEPLNRKIIKKLKISTTNILYVSMQRLRTLILFALCTSIGRAPSVKYGLDIVKNSLLNISSWKINFDLIEKIGMDKADATVLLIAVVLCVIAMVICGDKDFRDVVSKQILPVRWLIWYILIFGPVIFGFYEVGYDPSSFIYGGF